MANNIFKLIKNRAYQSFNRSGSAGQGGEIDAHALIRCTSEEAKSYIPFSLAERLSVLPLAVIETHNRKILAVASDDVSNDLQQSLKFACNIEIKLIKLQKNTLRKAISLAYHGSDSALAANMQKLTLAADQQQAEAANNKNLTALLPKDNQDCEINNFIKTILTYSIARKASDIHLLPCADGMRIKLRIDGELRTHENAVCNLGIYKKIISRIKTLSNLDTTKNDIAHDGSFSYQLEDSEISVRISIMPTVYGEKAVLRIHGMKELIRLEDLGLDSKTICLLKNVVSQMQGLIICTGATGSGKSTTLYGILEFIADLNKSIVTVEDPVEIRLDFASQTAINPKKGFGYSEMLKAALRQDPDCIMVGELRDSESTKIAVQAALTGHLVLTSLHAGSVTEAIQRLESMGINRSLISQTCRLIVHQQLVPKLCAGCRVSDDYLPGNNSAAGFRSLGCVRCEHTGLSGMAVINESLYIDETIKRFLMEANSNCSIESYINQDNFISMDENKRALIESGEISSFNI